MRKREFFTLLNKLKKTNSELFDFEDSYSQEHALIMHFFPSDTLDYSQTSHYIEEWLESPQNQKPIEHRVLYLKAKTVAKRIKKFPEKKERLLSLFEISEEDLNWFNQLPTFDWEDYKKIDSNWKTIRTSYLNYKNGC